MLAAASSALGQTTYWIGANNTSMNNAGRWSGGAVPGNGAIMTFSGNTSGNLSLTFNAQLGGTTGGSIKITGSQTGSLSITNNHATTSQNIRFANSSTAFVMDAGAGAFTLGGSGTNIQMVLGNAGGNDFRFINNSDHDALFSSNVNWATGGGAAALLTFAGTGNQTVAGEIFSNNAASSLAKEDSGILTLTGNSLASSITVNGGTIKIAGAGTLNSGSHAGTVAVNSGGTLNFSGSADQTLSGVVSGGGNLVKSGTGTLTLSNTANTLSGVLTIANGNLSIGTINDANSNGVLGNSANAVVLGGTGTTGTLRYTGATASSTKTFSLATGGSGGFDVTNAATSLTLTGVISGSGSLIKTGSGNLSLSPSSNTFSGGLNIRQGGVFGDKAASFGTGLITLGETGNSNAATLGMFANITVANNILVTSGGTRIIEAQGNILQPAWSGDITLNGDVTMNMALTDSGSNRMRFTGNISGVGGVNLTRSGTHGDFILFSGDNTYGGSTTINANTELRINSASGNGVPDSSTVILTGASSELRIQTDETIGSLESTGIYGSLALSSPANTPASTLTTGFNNQSTSWSGTSSGNGTLVKVGIGTFTIAAAQGYTGSTNINGGTLRISGGNNRLPTAGAVVLADVSGATLDLNGNNQTIGSLAGGGTSGGAVTLGSGVLTVGDANSTTFAGIISGTGGGFTKSGTGTLILSNAANSYSGATTISGGVLEVTTLANGGSASSIGASTNVAANLVLAGGTLRFSRTSAGTTSTNRLFTVSANSSIDASGSGNSGALIRFTNTGDILWGTAGQARALTLNAGTVGNNIIDSRITDNGAGKVTLLKEGSGNWQFTANNTYSGGTIINGGFLRVGAGTASGTVGTGNVTVASGATLSFGRTDTFEVGNFITGGGTVHMNNTGVLILTNNNTYSGTTNVNASGGTIQMGNGGTSGDIGTSNVFINTGGTFRINRADEITFSNPITGTGNFVHSGAGTTLLTGANTHTGSTTASHGVLLATTTATLPGYNASGKVIINGGTLGVRMGGAGWTIAQVDTLLTNATRTSGALGIDTTNANLTQWTPFTTNLGALGLTKLGPNTLTLNQANSYTGATTISGGVLEVTTLANGGTNSSIGASTNAAANLVLNGATLRYTGADAETNRLFTLAASSTIDASGSGHLRFTNTGSLAYGTANQARTLTLTGSYNGTTPNRIASLIANNGSGVVSIVKDGAGQWQFTGNNTYSGTTTINDGLLRIGAGGTIGTLGAGNVILTNGTSVINFNRSDTVTVANQISGAGILQKSGAGTMILTANNTYSGLTQLFDTGVLQVGNNGTTGALGSGGIQLADTSTLRFSRSNDMTLAQVISGAGGLSQVGSGTTILSGNNTFTGNVSVTGGTLALQGNPNVSNPTASAIGNTQVARTLTVGSAATLRFGTSNVMGDAGSSPLINIIVNGGTVTNAGAQFTALGNITLNGGTLTGTGGATSGYEMYGFQPNSTVTAGGTSASTISGSGSFNGYHLGANTVFDVADATSSSAADLTVSGVLIDRTANVGGVGGLTKTGSGTILLSAANTYGGLTAIQNGVLRISHGDALGSGGFSGTSMTTIASGAALEIDGSLALIEHFQAQGTGIGGTGAIRTISGNSSIATALALMANTSIGVDANSSLNLIGSVYFNGGLTKVGAGVLTLSGANSYSGNTLINEGAIRITHANALGTTAGITTVASTGGGELQLAGGINTPENITLNGRNTAAVHLRNISGSNTISGNISQGGGGATYYYASDAGLLTISGNITGVNAGTATRIQSFEGPGDFLVSGIIANGNANNPVAITKTGSGTLTLTANNTFSGPTNVNGGLLLINSGILGSTAVTIHNGGTLQIGGVGNRLQTTTALTINAGGTFDLRKNQQIDSLNGAGDIVGSVSNYSLTVGGGNFSGNHSGTTGFTKNTGGTLILSGNNTYSGATNVTAGTLIINGSTSSTSLVTVASGATLGGNGTVGGNATISGIHSPGNSAGIQSFGGNLTYNNGSSVTWELVADSLGIRGSDFDGIDIAANLNFAGATSLDLVFNSAGGTVDWANAFWDDKYLGTDGWLIFDVVGSNSNFNNLSNTVADWLDGNSVALSAVRPDANFRLFQDGNNVYLNYAVPEPRAALLGGLGLLILLRRRR